MSGWRSWRKFETWREKRIIELWARRWRREEWNATWVDGTLKIYWMSRVNCWQKMKLAILIFYFSHYHFEHKFRVLLQVVSFVANMTACNFHSTAQTFSSSNFTIIWHFPFARYWEDWGSFGKWADSLLFVALYKGRRAGLCFIFQAAGCWAFCVNIIFLLLFLWLVSLTLNFFHLLFICFNTHRALLCLILPPSRQASRRGESSLIESPSVDDSP